MVITGALLLQLAAPAAPDSTYSSAALRDFVGRAAAANAAPPPQLRGYAARLESEIAIVARDPIGREDVGHVEQLAARGEWKRDGTYGIHVIGYRASPGSSPISALTFTRTYSVPVLYGNRLVMGINDGLAPSKDNTARRAGRRIAERMFGSAPTVAVHPLAVDRERYYRFRGGDTVAILQGERRAIRLVRVYADPLDVPGEDYTVFRGELDFDADRHQLVRMRGRFEDHKTRKDPLFVRAMDVVGVAYVEFENAEIEGRYWLPHRQRSELHVHMGLMGEVRPAYRIITRFREHQLLEDSSAADDTLPIPATRAALTWAKDDSASRFGDWNAGLGEAISAVHADDFMDLAPEAWRPTGAPKFTLWPRSPDEVIRYNRIEGLFTGVAASMELRDAFPGLTAIATAGWGWSERSPRGYGMLRLDRGQWLHMVTGGRVLAPTGDLTARFEDDYVDRYSGSWLGIRRIGANDRARLAASLAYVADRYAPATVLEAPLGGIVFRPNRLVDEGAYARAIGIAELNPRVNGYALAPGYGARVRYEIASGELDWQRIDVRLAARRYWSGLLFSTRLDGGLVASRLIPTQTLFEIGGGLELPSYEYKEFGGDRAALGQASVAYYFPFLRTPKRQFGLILPAPSPGISLGVQGGWTEASTAAARASLLRLGGSGGMPVSRPTERIRSTIDIRATFFSGAIGVGFARPLDQPGPWTFFFGG